MEEKEKQIVSYYYQKFLEQDYSNYLGWIKKFEESYNFFKELSDQIQNNKSLEKYLESNNKKEGIDGKESFIKYFWISSKNNGFGSPGQSTFTKDDKDRFKEKEIEKRLISKIKKLLEINEEPPKQIGEKYSEFKDWMKDLDLNRNSWIRINRLFLAIFPEQMTTLISDNKVNYVCRKLGISEKQIKDELEVDEVNQFHKHAILTSKLEEIIEERVDEGLKDNDEVSKKSIFWWYLHSQLDDSLNLKQEMVYYGVPGTGKTYEAREMAEKKFEFWQAKRETEQYQLSSHFELIQFHPSFDYEDFIEGIRPGKITGDGKAPLELKNGIFKDFCKRAGKWEIDYYNLCQAENEEIDSNKEEGIGKKFSELTLADLEDKQDELTSDGYTAEWEETFEFMKADEQAPEETKVIDYIPPYFFVIDEINRAELSRVLGELMYCLEYRGYEGKVKTQYSYLINDSSDDTAFYFEENEGTGENYFFIPHNVYLIGTMNTVDRSVESFDFALRRRFEWEEKEPNSDVLKSYLRKNGSSFSNPDNIDRVVEGFKNLNDKITEKALLGKEYRVGHTYLFEIVDHLEQGKDCADARESIWEHNIKPLLKEYLRGVGRENDVEDNLEELEDDFLENNED